MPQVLTHSLNNSSIFSASVSFVALSIPLHIVRAMRREHVYAKCIRCSWRQRSRIVKGNICFEEYYCKECAGPLLICVDVRNDNERNKNKDADQGHQMLLSKITSEPRQ